MPGLTVTERAHWKPLWSRTGELTGDEPSPQEREVLAIEPIEEV